MKLIDKIPQYAFMGYKEIVFGDFKYIIRVGDNCILYNDKKSFKIFLEQLIKSGLLKQ